MNLLTACDCSGCADGWPRPDCSACGKRAVIVLEGHGHLMSLCRRCEAVVLEVRAQVAPHQHADEDPLVYVRASRGRPPVQVAPPRPPGWRAHRRRTAGTTKSPQ